jgi:hypothetical protein
LVIPESSNWRLAVFAGRRCFRSLLVSSNPDIVSQSNTAKRIMQPPERSSSDIQAELIRRHRAAALTVRALIALTVLLSLVAFLGRNHFRHEENETLDRVLRITILVFGLGSVVLRRRTLSVTRLQDIAALNGLSGLLSTLASTTVQVALLGAAMAIFGFIATVMTGNEFYSYGAGLVGFVVLIYCYPTRSSWTQIVQKLGPAAS